MAYGSVMASFNVEDFGTERVSRLDEDEIADRLGDFRRLTHFEEVPLASAPRPVAARMESPEHPHLSEETRWRQSRADFAGRRRRNGRRGRETR